MFLELGQEQADWIALRPPFPLSAFDPGLFDVQLVHVTGDERQRVMRMPLTTRSIGVAQGKW